MSGPIVLALRVGLAIALYAFLGVALSLIWQELRRASNEVALRQVPPIHLEVRTKRRAPFVRAFSQAEIVLGRDPLADVPLSDSAVSSRHALLSFHDGQWWISDLGSKNGTLLNREDLTVPTVLMSGDEIRCGQSRVLITLKAKPLKSNGHDAG